MENHLISIEREELLKEALSIINELADEIFEDYEDFQICKNRLRELVRRSRVLRRSKYFKHDAL